MAKKKAARPTKKKTKTARRATARVGIPKKKAAAPKRATTAKEETKFFGAGRGKAGMERKQFHVLLTKEEHALLATLTHKMKLSAADVFRSLLSKAGK